MKRYIKCSNATFPLDIYEFLDWFNDRNPDYRIYNDDIDLVSCDFSSKTLARFPTKLEVSESEAESLEQKILDALHKYEDNALSGNIDFDGYIDEGLLDYLIKHIKDLDNETISKLIDNLYRKSRWGNNKIYDLVKMPGLPKAAIDKLKSLRYIRDDLAVYNPDLSDKERTEILISDYDDLNYVSLVYWLKPENHIPDEVLRHIVLNSGPRTRVAVAKRPNLSPDIVDLLKNDKSIVVRREIDKNY